MIAFEFYVKGIILQTTINSSYDIFSDNLTEIHNYVLTLGGFIENSNTAVFNSDEAAKKMVDKLYSLIIP